jgi:TRAP-type C4-dicarboxylate transport system permease small subunit
LKAESAIIATVSVCIFLAFYFSYLSFQTFNDSLKRQFVLLAVSFLLIGATIFGCLTIYIGIKKIFVKAELSEVQETQEDAGQSG